MFAGALSLQITLMVSVVALKWILSFFLFLCDGALREDCGAGNN